MLPNLNFVVNMVERTYTSMRISTLRLAQYIHTSCGNYETNGCGHDLNLLTILHQLCVLYLTKKLIGA